MASSSVFLPRLLLLRRPLHHTPLPLHHTSLPRTLSYPSRLSLHLQSLRHASKKAAGKSKPASKGKPAKPSSAPVTKPKPTPPPPPPKPQYLTIADKLAHAGKPTLLYANHPTRYILACYGLSVGSLGWCLHIYNKYLSDDDVDFRDWWPKLYVGSIVVMAFCGLSFGYFPMRIVQKIYAQPVLGVGSQRPSLSIVIHRRPILPGFPVKKILIEKPKSLSLSEPLNPSGIGAEGLKKARPSGSLARRALDAIRQAPYRTFLACHDMLTNKNFIFLREAEGYSWPLHKNGWVWERRGLERLFPTNRHE